MGAVARLGGRPSRPVRVRADVSEVERHLPGWDHVDAFEIGAEQDPPVTARTAALCLMDLSGPGRHLLRARDRVVGLVGLRPAAEPGRQLFPVLHEDDELVVLGLDDRHLDFRVLVRTRGGLVRCTTAVRRHNGLGRAYFALVAPFHLRLVPHLLARAARSGWRPAGEEARRG